MITEILTKLQVPEVILGIENVPVQIKQTVQFSPRLQAYSSHLPPEDLAFHGQAPPLIIVEQNAFLAELFSEHAILGPKVLDYFLLSMIDPAGEDQNKQLPRLQDEFHTTPDGVGSKGNSIPDQRVAVNQPKQNSRELLQESSFQPHAGRLTFFTLRVSPLIPW